MKIHAPIFANFHPIFAVNMGRLKDLQDKLVRYKGQFWLAKETFGGGNSMDPGGLALGWCYLVNIHDETVTQCVMRYEVQLASPLELLAIQLED